MRILYVLPIAMVVAFFTFWLMSWMIQPPASEKAREDNVAMVDFIRSLRDSETQTKERNLKEPPKPKSVPSPSAPKVQAPALAPLDMSMPDLSMDLNNIKGSGLGTMLGGYGVGDNDVIPLVDVPPRYPAQAQSRGIEGWVTVQIQITKEGTVEDVKVLDADPKGVFERESIRAAWRMKFKAKLVNGKPVEQTAVKTYEFSLEK